MNETMFALLDTATPLSEDLFTIRDGDGVLLGTSTRALHAMELALIHPCATCVLEDIVIED